MQHYGGVNILRLNRQKKISPLARNTRESWKIIARDRRVSCSRCLRYKFKFLQHDILKREPSIGRIHAQVRRFRRLSNVSFARRYPDLSPVP